MHVKSLHTATQQNSSRIIKLYRLLHFCIEYLIPQELFYTFTLFHNYVYSDYLHCLPQLPFYHIFPFSFAGFQPAPPRQTLPGPALTPSSPAPFGGFLQILAGLLPTFLSGPLFTQN